MSSSPTTETSTKAAQLHKHERRFNLRSSSFAGLGPFHKKPAPQNPEQKEPYEVAPGTGILNTDATAIVFGYLDREKQEEAKRKKKKKHSKPGTRRTSRSSSPVKKYYDRYKEVHNDDGTDDFQKRTHRKHVEAGVEALQKKRDDSYRVWKESQERSKRGRMVSEEDKLHSRGANPRTGIVTPYPTSDGSIDSGYGTDYLGARAHQGPTVNQGSWRQNDQGWSLVEDAETANYALQPPTAEPTFHKPQRHRKPSTAKGQIYTNQILDYQRSIKRAYRDGNHSKPFVHPDTAPSPRQWTPPGPSSPPPRLTKIPRKKVGSGMSQRQESEETVVIDGRARAASVPPPQHYPANRHRVRIVTPQHSAHGSTVGKSHTHLDSPRSFLGHHPGMSSNRYPQPAAACVKDADLLGRDREAVQTIGSYPKMTSSTYPSQQLNLYVENLPSRSVQGHQGHSVSGPATPRAQVTNSGMRRNIPILRFPHPSQFKKLPPTFRCPPNLWPSPTGENVATQDVTDVFTTTTSITTTPATNQRPIQSSLRPKPTRQDGSTTIPKEYFQNHGELSSSISTQNLPYLTTTDVDAGITIKPEKVYSAQYRTTRVCPHATYHNNHAKKHSSPAEHIPATPALTDQASSTPTSNPMMPTRDRGETYNGWVVPDELTVPTPYPTTAERFTHGGYIAKSNQNTSCHTGTSATAEEWDIDAAEHREDHDIHGMTAGSGNTAARPQRGRSHGGAIPLDGALDDAVNCGVPGLRMKAWRNKWKLRGADAETLRRGDQEEALRASVHGKADRIACGITRQDSLKRRIAELKCLSRGINLHFQPYFAAQYGFRHLVIMVHHVLVTFHPSSPALMILRTEDANGREYWAAVKNVLWATLYLVLLVNLTLLMGRAVKAVVQFGRVFMVPVRFVWAVMRWCLFG